MNNKEKIKLLNLKSRFSVVDLKEIRSKIKIIEPLLQTPKRDKAEIHTLYSYPAKFQAHVPEIIIESFSKPGHIILDPFGGGGTTAASSLLKGRNVIHYDMSPLSCLVAKAKTTSVTRSDSDQIISSIKKLSKMKKYKQSILTNEEQLLFGENIAKTADIVLTVLNDMDKNQSRYLLAVLVIKFLKLCGRRDAEERRNKAVHYHIDWFEKELSKFASYSESHLYNKAYKAQIVCQSNHNIRLKDNSVDLIITSPPYIGVDIEYFQIQLQRRDLKKCYRSDIAIRIANNFFNGNPDKKSLCRGGDKSEYFENVKLSLLEMRRVLKPESLAFLYTGFKSQANRDIFEDIVNAARFELIERSNVILSHDRIASSRSTHHGKETNMMKKDYLYILG